MSDGVGGRTKRRRPPSARIGDGHAAPAGPHERAVAESLADGRPIARDVAAENAARSTRGARAADAVARVAGSWGFIGLFVGVLASWMALNGLALGAGAFDPYPFILLNLALSCMAAVQAPVIMMSQRRQDERDRLAAENDYRVNLKAELELREAIRLLEALRAEHARDMADLRARLGAQDRTGR